MKKRHIATLTITLTCLFTIIGARVTVSTVVNPNQCVIHNLPSSTVVLLNTTNGIIGEVAPFPSTCSERFLRGSDSIIPTVYYEFECQYPDFIITSNMTSRHVRIEIHESFVFPYDYQVASIHICHDCLKRIEQIKPASSILFIANQNDTICMHSIDDIEHGFSLLDYYFTLQTRLDSSLVIQMERNPSNNRETDDERKTLQESSCPIYL